MYLKLQYSLLVLLFSMQANAINKLRDTSVRALGMGGAYISVVDNNDALLYNPASLSKIGGIYLTVLDPKIGISNIDKISALQSADSGSVSSLMDEIYGEPIWVGASAKSVISFPYFSFGVYDNSNLLLEASSPAFPKFDVNFLSDFGYALGLAFPVLPGFLYAGTTVRHVSRTGGHKILQGGDLLNLDVDGLKDQFTSKSTGIGLDFSMNFSLPLPLITPTLTFAWYDIGNTSYRIEGDGEPAPMDESEMSLGGALVVDSKIITITPAVEFRGINQGGGFLDKTHLGVEIDMPIVDLRAGFYQGYYSLGVGLSMGLAQLELATYGVELGEHAGQKEDRRYVLQLTVDFNMGSGISLFGASGPKSKSTYYKRRLKQRR